MNRQTDIRCAIGEVHHEECAFVLTQEMYGSSAAIRGACTVHEGGEVIVNLSVMISRPKNDSPVRELRTVMARRSA